MSVTRYEFELYHCNGGEMLVSDTGDYVSYDDYAALEARCAALAAENAGLKKFCEDAAFYADYEAELGMERGGFTEGLSLVKTQQTEAFLAEVRASAVDEACLKISNAIINCYQDEMVGLDEAATICGDFAAQLRKGGATEERQSFLSDEDCQAFVKAFTKGAAQ